MMHWFLRWVFLPVLGVLLVALVAATVIFLWGNRGDDLGPLLEFNLPTPEPRVPWTQDLGRYSDSSERLAFVTPVVEPALAPTPRPTPDFSQLVRPMLPASTPIPSVMDLGEDTCEGHFRLMLVDLRGGVFGPALVLELSQRFLEERPDCSEDGWAPEFGLSPVCVGDSVAGFDLPAGLLSFGRYDRKGKARPTMLDPAGGILVHFDRMPFWDAQGCWFYNPSRMSWAWFIRGVGRGVDVPQFPGCEGPLRSGLESLSESGEVRVLDVARLIDELRHEIPGCEGALWDPYPARSPHEDCSVQSELGLTEEGLLVVHWNLGHLPSDQAVCWYVEPGSGIWDISLLQVGDGPAPVIPDESGG